MFADGSVECEVRFRTSMATTPACWCACSNPRRWRGRLSIGYEISLGAESQTLLWAGTATTGHPLQGSAAAPVKPGALASPARRTARPELPRFPGWRRSSRSSTSPTPSAPAVRQVWPCAPGTPTLRSANVRRARPEPTSSDDFVSRQRRRWPVSGMWDAFHTGTARPRLHLGRQRPLQRLHSPEDRTAARRRALAGVANRGLNRWGIAVQQGPDLCRAPLYLRAARLCRARSRSPCKAPTARAPMRARRLGGIGADWAQHPFRSDAERHRRERPLRRLDRPARHRLGRSGLSERHRRRAVPRPADPRRHRQCAGSRRA